MTRNVAKNEQKIHKKWLFRICTRPKNPGTYFLGRKKRLRQDAWEYGTFKEDQEIMILFQKIMKIDIWGWGDGFGVLRDIWDMENEDRGSPDPFK